MININDIIKDFKDDVVYVQCPNCHKGYAGKLVDIEADEAIKEIKKIVIFTIENVNLYEKQVCYNCGHKYTPAKSAKIKRIDEYTADRLMNMKVE